VGDRLDASALVAGHGDEVRARLQRCVTALQRMVDGGWFVDHEDTVGIEVGFDLVDPLGRARLINDAVLDAWAERTCSTSWASSTSS
jgi:hypothetical protein